MQLAAEIDERRTISRHNTFHHGKQIIKTARNWKRSNKVNMKMPEPSTGNSDLWNTGTDVVLDLACLIRNAGISP